MVYLDASECASVEWICKELFALGDRLDLQYTWSEYVKD